MIITEVQKEVLLELLVAAHTLSQAEKEIGHQLEPSGGTRFSTRCLQVTGQRLDPSTPLNAAHPPHKFFK
ncbi:hypothetical protein CLAIMM_00860 [Cladophialophora immunda]|nr:hypothetical protein CLAIMM_00860 [Cladophialophora immunda]